MLTSLSIKNYALIDHLQVDFNNGFTIITGETGAGKSILLGGLSLILGKRADLSSLRNKEKKCVIEANFDVTNYKLETLFKLEDLDFEPQTIIRREILPSGKSRAFVNDSPVKLSSLQALGERLIDIHSQHETLQMVDDSFQFQVIDALANTQKEISNYSKKQLEYKALNKDLEKLIAFQTEAIKEHDYNSFLLNELTQAKLKAGELETLEEELEMLSNIDAIQEKLTTSNQLLSDEQIGVLSTLTELKNTLKQVSVISNKYEDLYSRANSSLIELDDVFSELETFQENLEADPNRLQEVNGRLTIINNLFQKHVVSSIEELIVIENQLSDKVLATENVDSDIAKKKFEILKVKQDLDALALLIHNKRQKAIPSLKEKLEAILAQLGMPNAQFNIVLSLSETYYLNGKDSLDFLFSANKGGEFKPLKKAASGGELSRIMLAIKSILTQYIKLPTIMFDEIDTGVSGEISNKMADIMAGMSKTMQVFSITHLPQIAAKGHTHFKVYKKDVNEVTTTNLVKLNHDERIVEIAQMLGGVDVSNSALAHAKELLN
ncbi:DNA replication and repair protein RecN [Lacinutrix venerupis]|uniref:DNA repair protein RecN n=1 Tax=Lacinutrix venerupis TaxID=1486034 RepID=UPI000EAD37EC|nr:DNA repair protein RecN [Lacinutrix venerupis]RLJ64284.1 DNA replication and repair protein RecN [Lacinutrix venerupis]